MNLPTTEQYQVETQREEEYHLRQWLGTVPSLEGGQGDCFTAKGVQYHAKMFAQDNAIDFLMDGVGMLVLGTDSTNVWSLANAILAAADSNETAESLRIWDADRGFIEARAKQFADYNAAWRYHCTYEAQYGSSPTNNIHPAFITP